MELKEIDHRIPVLRRFQEKVQTPEGCWIWVGATSDGYGVLTVSGKSMKAHRVSYLLFVGPIPEGLFVCHRCDTPLCVNPAHMFLADHKGNMQDMKEKRRAVSGDAHWKRNPVPEPQFPALDYSLKTPDNEQWFKELFDGAEDD